MKGLETTKEADSNMKEVMAILHQQAIDEILIFKSNSKYGVNTDIKDELMQLIAVERLKRYDKINDVLNKKPNNIRLKMDYECEKALLFCDM